MCCEILCAGSHAKCHDLFKCISASSLKNNSNLNFGRIIGNFLKTTHKIVLNWIAGINVFLPLGHKKKV